MKLSYNWLSDYVDLTGISVEEVAEKLTMGAFEVEEITRVGPELTGPVVVGEIKEINQHPNADKIRMTKTVVKEGDPPQDIVCGAQNIEVGQRIPVALPGARVVNRKTFEPLEIKSSEIRGVKSEGMLCSPPELGITDGDSEGILILDPEKFSVGDNLIEKLDLRSDWILHVEPRSNRGDALCVIGLAREVAALLGKPLKDDIDLLPADEAGKDTDKSADLAVTIEDETGCNYFSTRILKNIKISESPAFIKRRLEALGLRSVNNIVDITNYVMLETGQPLHAYDLDKVNGELAVRRARAGEKLETIDAKVREMNEEILVIADDDAVLGVAGVMGGKDSEISDSTTRIALEAASFNPKVVRRSSRLLGLSSDSSHRFERGVDVTNVKKASDRATFLIEKFGGSEKEAVSCEEFLTAGDASYEPRIIELRPGQTKRLLGVEIPQSDCKRYLESLGFEETDASGAENLAFKIPSFRATDVLREVDLIEEICRLYGYDRIEDAMPSRTVAPPTYCRLETQVRKILSGEGLSEAWISSLRPENETVRSGGKESEDQVHVLNPLSKDHQVLRQSLVPGLLDALKYNSDHGNKDCWLFEIGRSYHLSDPASKNGNGASSDRSDTGAEEKRLVAAVICGSLLNQFNIGGTREEKTFNHAQMTESIDFYRIKGLLENLLENLNIDESMVEFKKDDSLPSFLHPHRSCSVALSQGNKKDKKKSKNQAGETFGWLAEIHPRDAHKLGFKEAVYAFEINLDLLRKYRAERDFSEPAQTPSIARDLTADLEITVQQSDVMKAIKNAAGKKLERVDLVSVFDLSETKRSLSYRLIFQDKEETLTNEEVEKRLNKIRNSLTHQLSATFRA